MKFMCFASTLSYPQKEFLNPRPPRTRTKCNPHPPRNKFNPHPPGTRTQSSAGSRTRSANAGTRNPRGLTRLAQDSSLHCTTFLLIYLTPLYDDDQQTQLLMCCTSVRVLSVIKSVEVSVIESVHS